MPSIPWEQVRDVVDAVLDLPADARPSYLDQACPQPAVRRYVESLIHSYEQAGAFLDEPAAVHHALTLDAGESWKGRRVGAYQIIEHIGEGGMGEVYRAVRADDQYRKEVAIKLVRVGFDSRFTVARFKAERQILANLDHPNITRLLDGGATEEGQPYLVMEYVQGVPLDEYCDRHRLSVTDRLRLFRTVCSAVQFAHQNLVIHRDIKPANILVTKDGTAKLLDFGIAKILAPDAEDSTALQTLTQVRLLTPEYASPEQLRGEVITTASDVYSLGVVLYELLTGHRPYRLLSRNLDEISRAVTETEPEKPSTAITRAEESVDPAGKPRKVTPEAVSDTREGSVEKLRRRLSGDLDNIVLMALRKEAPRRYASVEQFSADIGRHLEGHPVAARTDTFTYRSSKFVRRHATAVTAAVLVALSLILGLAVALREARIARVQRARAERRFNDVRKLANSLIFDIHDSIQHLPGSTAARKLIVQRALEYLDSLSQEAHDDVPLQRELAYAYERVGDVQGWPGSANLGDQRGALASYQKAHAIRKALLPQHSTVDMVRYAANSRGLSYLQFYGSDAAAALKSAQEGLAVTQVAIKSDPSNREVLTELASDYAQVADILSSGGSGSADIEGTYQKALEIDERLAAVSNDSKQMRRVAVDLLFIGRRLWDTGYETQAAEALNRVLVITEKLGVDSDNTLAQRDLAAAHTNVGDALVMSGAPAEALPHYHKALEIATRLAAADSNNQDARLLTGEAALNVGTTLATLKKPAEALAYIGRAIGIFEKALASNARHEGASYDLALAYVWRASVLSAQSTPAVPGAALEDFHNALAIVKRLASVDPGNSDWQEAVAAVHVKTGDFFRQQSQPGAAEKEYRQSSALAEKLAAADPHNPQPHYLLANANFGMGELSIKKAELLQRSQERATALGEAKTWYRRSADAWRQIPRPTAISADGFTWGSSKDVDRAIARCNAALGALGKPSAVADIH